MNMKKESSEQKKHGRVGKPVDFIFDAPICLCIGDYQVTNMSKLCFFLSADASALANILIMLSGLNALTPHFGLSLLIPKVLELKHKHVFPYVFH